MSLAPRDLLYLTLRSLASNPVRSLLTTLGTFMGVAAVSATLQVGTISRAVIARQLAEQEAPQVTVFSAWAPGAGSRVRLQQEDLQFLRQRLSGIAALSTSRWVFPRPVLFRDRQADPVMFAVSPDYLLTSGNSLASGRFFSETDFQNFRPVAMIDEVLAGLLFDAEDPIGHRLYVNRQPYTVVGVLRSRLNEDNISTEGLMLIPLSFYGALTGSQEIGEIRIRPQRLTELEAISTQAEQLLTQRYPGRRFLSWNNVEDILRRQEILTMASRALATVGVVSLLVGGVGIANIMIASVTERTSEIGIRRAIGATRREIMTQFILEAVLLSLIGGTVAIATVHGLTILVARQFDLPYRFNSQTATMALGSALLVGIGASFLPALRASQLDPVTALRSD